MNMFFAGGLAAIGLMLAAVPAQAQSVEFTLINNSSYALHYFYTTPSKEDSWGYDLLGEEGTLESGTQGTVTIGDDSDQCVYDFKFVMDNEAELIETEIDICELNSYTIND